MTSQPRLRSPLGRTFLAVTTASLLLAACAADPKPEYPDTPGFVEANAAFDTSFYDLQFDASMSVVFTVSGDHVTFSGSQTGGNHLENFDADLELNPGETGQLHQAMITLCDVWMSPRKIGLGPSREFWVYFTFSFTGAPPACPEQLS